MKCAALAVSSKISPYLTGYSSSWELAVGYMPNGNSQNVVSVGECRIT